MEKKRNFFRWEQLVQRFAPISDAISMMNGLGERARLLGQTCIYYVDVRLHLQASHGLSLHFIMIPGVSQLLG